MGTMRNTGAGPAKIMAVVLSLVMIFAGVPGMAQAQVTSLKDVPVPEPANLSAFVKDKQAAIALGKALFWDMQVGSDSVQACASCHSKAGADNRTKNQLNPGLNDNDVNLRQFRHSRHSRRAHVRGSRSSLSSELPGKSQRFPLP